LGSVRATSQSGWDNDPPTGTSSHRTQGRNSAAGKNDTLRPTLLQVEDAPQARRSVWAKAAASPRVATPSLPKMVVRWRLTVGTLIKRISAISWFVLPAATS